MQIFSWNVNGLRAVINKGALATFLAKHQPDVLCLQEIKADAGQVPRVLPDHHAYWHSASTKGYSGTAIFSKSSPLSVHNGFVKPVKRAFSFVDAAGKDAADEGRIITAEYPDFHLVTVYTPNAKDDLSRLPLRTAQWDPAFLAHCKALERTKPVIFCGDLNVAHTEQDLANPKTNIGNKGFTAEERAGFQAFIDAGFVDTFRMFTQGNGHYSWWSQRANCRARNVGWRIDYVLVSRRLAPRVTAAAIHADIPGSDHCPVSITIA
ncbi:MAG: exodeoxyribonuclease III [Gemmatimonadaceae bacterium]|nr:exodeoxyribonuclease III [Gemmatimonadaceae bacterium]